MRAATLVLGAILLTHAAAAQPSIYRCIVHGVPSYSDRPCEAGADPHEIDDSRVTVYTPPAEAKRASSASPKPPKTQRSKAGRAPDPAKHKATCAKLDQALRDVRTKMRGGYRAKEGERLKARQRQLGDRRRSENCR